MAKNILICDDAAFMRMMIKDILTKNGYNVVAEAENGLKAVEKYSEFNPDLVLMDITMPEMDGIETVKEIQKIATEEIPVIFLTALSDRETVQRCREVHAKDYIVRPFRPLYMLERVREAIGGSDLCTI